MAFFPRLVRHEGNAPLFSAIEISIVSSSAGIPLHVHVEGLRGTGKTSIMRAARWVLPPIVRIKGCRYNCDPDQPHCPDHAGRSPEYIRKLGREAVPMPFMEICHSAKLGTVVGSIDLEKLTDASSPSAALMPGVLPQAHRGIIFVDEINRLAETAPEITDILLSVMGTKPGFIKVEETGLAPVEMPVSVTVWAASNPDEDPGALEDVRRQLADRFDLVVAMGRPQSLDAVMKVLAVASAGRPVGLETLQDPDPDSQSQMQKLRKAALLLPSVELSSEVVELIARFYLDFGLESLRAAEAIKLAAMCHAAIAGRPYINLDDLKAVGPHALRHRTDPGTISRMLEALKSIETAARGATAAASVAGEQAARSPQNNSSQGKDLTLERRLRRYLDFHEGPAKAQHARQPQCAETGKSKQEGKQEHVGAASQGRRSDAGRTPGLLKEILARLSAGLGGSSQAAGERDGSREHSGQERLPEPGCAPGRAAKPIPADQVPLIAPPETGRPLSDIPENEAVAEAQTEGAPH